MHVHLQGEPFDWHLHIHRTLDGQLLAVLDSIYSLGICHCDLHQGNILVTSYKQIVLLDFAGANLESAAEERIAERNHFAMLLRAAMYDCLHIIFDVCDPSDVSTQSGISLTPQRFQESVYHTRFCYCTSLAWLCHKIWLVCSQQ